jgi:hypothetical protein
VLRSPIGSLPKLYEIEEAFRRLFLEALKAAFDGGKLRNCQATTVPISSQALVGQGFRPAAGLLPGVLGNSGRRGQLERLFHDELLASSVNLKNSATPKSSPPTARTQAYLALLGENEWAVYAKPPFGGAVQALEYLGRYTHRVALSNDRLLATEPETVTFQWKDYRDRDRSKSRRMTLDTEEFIRRFLIHVLPGGFQRIRHCGFLANRHRKEKLELCRCLLSVPMLELLPDAGQCAAILAVLAVQTAPPCPQCGIGAMVRVRILEDYRWPARPRHLMMREPIHGHCVCHPHNEPAWCVRRGQKRLIARRASR